MDRHKYAIIILLLLTLPFLINATPTRTYTYTSGSVINPDEVTTNEDNLFRYLQVGVDTYADDSIVSADIYDGTIANVDISGSAAISYSKLNLSSSILTGDIKDGEIVNADISSSASIVDTKLAQIATASKVSGAALTSLSSVPSGAGQVPVANLGTGTGSSANFLRGDGSWQTINYIANSALYFEPDGTAIVQLDNASAGKDFIGNTLTLTSLADSDLVAGKVSRKCYNLDGSNDFFLIAHNANQAGMAALTIEMWVYADTLSGDDYVLYTASDAYFSVLINDTNISVSLVTSSGTESINLAHNESPFTGEWHYVVITWDNTGPGDIYLDGVDLGNGNDAGNGTISDSASGINIGAVSAGNNHFDGKIDGLRILRRKMTATEVSNKYSAFQ